MSNSEHSPSSHGHVPVLLEETLSHLTPEPGSVVIDLTAGRGGHAEALAQHLDDSGTIVLCDLDHGNLEQATRRVEAATSATVLPIQGSFARIPRELTDRGLAAARVLGDLGFSSTQMDDPERGFSIMNDGPLDMRFCTREGRTAASLLASMSEAELTDIIRRYGEDPYARSIARFLVRRRAEEPILTTADLARCVRQAYGHRAHSSRLHPATRTFQALRIAVNDELGALDGLLGQVETGAVAVHEARPSWLEASARVGFITFHSLEDRLVKQTFVQLERRGLARRMVRKPIVASASEVADNPRARSAKLRVATVGDPSD